MTQWDLDGASVEVCCGCGCGQKFEFRVERGKNGGVLCLYSGLYEDGRPGFFRRLRRAWAALAGKKFCESELHLTDSDLAQLAQALGGLQTGR